jgi:hypothetical protein
MDFLPAVPMTSIPAYPGHGGIAVDSTGTLLANVETRDHCVRIYRVDAAGVCLTTAAVVVGTPGTDGNADGLLHTPTFACFVHRNGLDTLLICDRGNDRLVEVTTDGAFLRGISVQKGGDLWGIAYCGISDVIAVSLESAHLVLLLDYVSGVAKPEGTIGSDTATDNNGELYSPMGVAFTADGLHLLVADCNNYRVGKFSTATGVWIADAATLTAPRDVLQLEDGTTLVLYSGGVYSLVCVTEDGEGLSRIALPALTGHAFPYCFACCKSTNAVFVKTFYDGKIILLRDAFKSSSRAAWLSATAM